MIFIGVDPGLDGAIAFVREDGKLLAVEDMPVMQKSKTKSKIDAAGLYRLMADHAIEQPDDVQGAIENVWAMPKQGASSGCSIGHSVGICEGVLMGSQVPTEMVTPQTWKKYYGLGRDKELARAKAISLYPKAELGRKKDADRAEAILIALWRCQTYWRNAA